MITSFARDRNRNPSIFVAHEPIEIAVMVKVTGCLSHRVAGPGACSDKGLKILEILYCARRTAVLDAGFSQTLNKGFLPAHQAPGLLNRVRSMTPFVSFTPLISSAQIWSGLGSGGGGAPGIRRIPAPKDDSIP